MYITEIHLPFPHFRSNYEKVPVALHSVQSGDSGFGRGTNKASQLFSFETSVHVIFLLFPLKNV